MLTKTLLLENELLGGERARERQARILRDRKMIYTLVPVGELEGHEGCVNSVSFSKEGGGRHVVTGSDDCTVKVWDVHAKKCLRTLYGPTSNVFATHFVPGKGDAEIVAGGNDGDIWHYDVNRDFATRYSIHSRKVLSLSFCPGMPTVFLSSSGDGTVRMIDLRMRYDTSLRAYRRIRDMQPYNEDIDDLDVVPQALGGGHFQPIDSIQVQHGSALCVTYRDSTFANGANSTLVLNYRRCPGLPAISALYSVEFHPTDPYAFIVSSEGDGNVRRFDLRYIREAMPASYTNIYRNTACTEPIQCMGCTYSARGDLVAASYLGTEDIYCFDADAHYPDAWYGKSVRKKRRVPKERLTRYEPREEGVPVFDEYSGELRRERLRERSMRLALARRLESERGPRDRKRRALDWTEEPVPQVCGVCGEACNGLSLCCKDCGTVLCAECYLHDAESLVHKSAHNNVHIVQPLGYEGGTSDESFECFHVGCMSRRGYSDAQLENIKSIIRENMEKPLYGESRELSFTKYADIKDEQEDATAMTTTEGGEEGKNDRKVQTYFMSYAGHVSECTSKGCTFLGPNSEFLASGSDDHKAYIWERESGDLIYALDYHNDIVNSVTQQPCGGTIIATGGLEDYVCLWDSVGEMPTQDEIDESIERRIGEGNGAGILDINECSIQ